MTGDRSELLQAQVEAVHRAQRPALHDDAARRRRLSPLDPRRGRPALWANQAYLRAVEARDLDDAIGRSLELLDAADPRGGAAPAPGRRDLSTPASRPWSPASARVLDVVERPTAGGSAGIAVDVSELEAVRTDLQRQMDAHVRTLDQLPTAVAIFDGSQNLIFSNAAYQRLWGLDAAFLASRPIGQRGARPPARGAQAARAGGFPRLEGRFPARLPLGRAAGDLVAPARPAHACASSSIPNPQGGVTYLFDDVSERFELDSQVHCAHPRAERDPRHPEGRRRRVRLGRAPQAAQPRLRGDVEPGAGDAGRATRISMRSSRPAACSRRRTSPGSTSAARWRGLPTCAWACPAASSGATAPRSTAPRSPFPTARRS